MKTIFHLLVASFVAVLFYTASFAQKFIVNDAGKLINNYNPMDSLSASKKLLAKAKDLIDLAAVNTETSESIQMYMYRGKIYFGLIEVAAMESDSTGVQPDEALLEEYEAIARTSFNKVYEDPKKKYITDIQSFLNYRSSMYFNMAISAYETKKYDMATQLFIGAIQVKSFLNEKYPDAVANAQFSLSLAVDSLLKTKSYDAALEIAKKVNDAIPSNINVLISLVNIYLQKGDVIDSEKYLNEALAIDPMNKQLYYVLGTASMDLKENEKAEKALTKALEIDPNYNDAQYQLGAHLYNWAGQLKYEAGQLPENDASYDPLMEKATAMQYRSLALIQAYDEKNPCNKDVFEILQKSYSKLGDNEKSDAYKMRILIFTYLSKNDSINLVKYINKILEIDPNNKQFYFNLGISHMCLNQNEKAEKALTKALEIDPNYNDAQYQLGAHLYNWAAQLKYEAGQLPENDPSYDRLIEKATKMQYRSLALLESYIIVKPEDKAVLEILRSTYSKLGDSEKAAEYKKRIEALKKN